MPTITLPEGHVWAEIPSGAAQIVDFACQQCGAVFSHNMETGECGLAEGDDSHENPPPNFDHDPRFDEGGEFHEEANPTKEETK